MNLPYKIEPVMINSQTKEKQIEITVTMKNGEQHSLDPAINITIDNTFHKYDFDPREIETITIGEIE